MSCAANEMNEPLPVRVPFVRYFYFVVGFMLLAVAAMKAAAVIYGFKGMGARNPVLPMLSNLHVVGVAAVVELAVGCVVLFAQEFGPKRLAVYWIASVFVAYRLGLLIVGSYTSCGCLHGFSLLLESNSSTENAIATSILAFMLLGTVVSHLSVERSRFRRFSANVC